MYRRILSLPATVSAAGAAILIAAVATAPVLAMSKWVPLPTPKAVALGEVPLPGDAVRGKELFANCRACHETGPGAATRVGPHLNGIVGRPAGVIQGYPYSPAILEAGSEGLVWTSDFLKRYLAAPSKFLPNNHMAFVGLPSEKDRVDLVAYLRLLEAAADAGWKRRVAEAPGVPLPSRIPPDFRTE